jgi:hypothetical protein
MYERWLEPPDSLFDLWDLPCHCLHELEDHEADDGRCLVAGCTCPAYREIDDEFL